MRFFINVFATLLFLIGIVCIGASVLILVLTAERLGAPDLVGAAIIMSPVFAIGVMSLGFATVAYAVEQGSRDQVEAINRGTQVAIHDARHAANHRAAQEA